MEEFLDYPAHRIQLFLRKRAQRAAGSLARGTEGFWSNCSDKHLGKPSQVAELIFTACLVHVSAGTEVSPCSLSQHRVKSCFCTSQPAPDELPGLENEQRRGGCYSNGTENGQGHQTGFLKLCSFPSKCNTATVQKEISIINTKFGLV